MLWRAQLADARRVVLVRDGDRRLPIPQAGPSSPISTASTREMFQAGVATTLPAGRIDAAYDSLRRTGAIELTEIGDDQEQAALRPSGLRQVDRGHVREGAEQRDREPARRHLGKPEHAGPRQQSARDAAQGDAGRQERSARAEQGAAHEEFRGGRVAVRGRRPLARAQQRADAGAEQAPARGAGARPGAAAPPARRRSRHQRRGQGNLPRASREAAAGGGHVRAGGLRHRGERSAEGGEGPGGEGPGRARPGGGQAGGRRRACPASPSSHPTR